MTKLFEDWLVELAKNESFSTLEKLPDYLDSHYAKTGNRIAERKRLAAYFQNHTPRTPFSLQVLEVILGGG
jgi:hypothetical protein